MIEAPIVIADKGYDADERVLQPLAQAGKTAVIPPKANRKEPRAYDRERYKARHRIENFFCQLKQFRAIATRYDQDGTKLPGCYPLGGCHHLAQLRTDPR
jgi:transposase